jgi:hypothetical protein
LSLRWHVYGPSAVPLHPDLHHHLLYRWWQWAHREASSARPAPPSSSSSSSSSLRWALPGRLWPPLTGWDGTRGGRGCADPMPPRLFPWARDAPRSKRIPSWRENHTPLQDTAVEGNMASVPCRRRMPYPVRMVLDSALTLSRYGGRGQKVSALVALFHYTCHILSSYP